MTRFSTCILLAVLAAHFVTSAALQAGPAASRQDAKDGTKSLSELLVEASGYYIQKEYAKSNEVYAKVLQQLPPPSASGIDTMRGRIHYGIACNHAKLEDKRQALAYLEKAIACGFWDGEYLAKDPTLRSLHSTREFEALVRKARRALAGVAFGMTCVTGKKLEAKTYEGKALILDFWGTWCPPCRREIPLLIRLQNKYGDRGLRIIGLTCEKDEPSEAVRERVQDFVREKKINYPCVLLNRRTRAAIPRLTSYPTTLFIDRRGRVRERFAGFRDYGTLEKATLKLLEEPEGEGKP